MKALIGFPPSKSSMRKEPSRLLSAVVSLSTPLSPTPPEVSTAADPLTAAPAGSPELKSVEKVPAWAKPAENKKHAAKLAKNRLSRCEENAVDDRVVVFTSWEGLS